MKMKSSRLRAAIGMGAAVMLVACGPSEEEAEKQRAQQARSQQLEKIENAAAICAGIEPIITYNCEYHNPEDGYYSFTVRSLEPSKGPINELIPALDLPARIVSKLSNTNVLSGYVEDSYGIVDISWSTSVETIYTSTFRTIEINLQVN